MVSDVAPVEGAPTRPHPRAGGGIEELSADPGAVAERSHPGRWTTLVEGAGRCRFVRGRDSEGDPFVVVRQHSGRTWHRAEPGPSSPGRYELRLSGVVVSAHDATFTAIRRPEGGWVLVVLEGSVRVSDPGGGDTIELRSLQALSVSAQSELGQRRQLTPGDVDTQPWVVANRARDRVRDSDRGVPPSRPLPGPVRRGAPRPVARPGVPPAIGQRGAVGENLAHALHQAAPGWARLQRAATPRRVAVTALVVLAGLGLLPDQARTMLVTVNGRQVRVPRSQPTVAASLVAADLEYADGALLAAGTKTVLDAHFTPAIALVDGIPGSATTKVGERARIDVTPAPDVVEATGVRQAEVPPPPLPDVEYDLWYPGTSGIEEQVYGTVSGQIVSRTPMIEPIAPRAEQGNVVALTFDDGPHPVWTPQVLDILRSERVTATFCVVGALGEKHPDLVRAERDAGHTMCNHTRDHVLGLDRASPEKVIEQIEGGSQVLRSTLGEAPSLYRPPGGSLGPAVIEAAHVRGMRVLDWSIDSRDYTKPPAAALVTKILAAVRPGSVILLHDGDGDRSQTVAALRPLIQQLRARGFTFATPLGPPG